MSPRYAALALLAALLPGMALAQLSPPKVGDQPLVQIKPRAPALAACSEKLIKPIADRVTEEIGILINFTKAYCLPSADEGKCSILCFSDLNISGMNRNIVLMFITASAGKKMREAGISRFSSIMFADRELLLSKRALKLSAARASILQAGIASTAEKPEAVSSRIGAEYTEIVFKRP